MSKLIYTTLSFLTMTSLAFAKTHPHNLDPDTDTYNLTKIPDIPSPPSPNTIDTSHDVPSISTDELMNNPELLEQALYSSIMLGNTKAVKKLLPLYQQLPNAHDQTGMLLITLSQALLAQTDNNLKTAINKYRDILAQFPKMNDVRLVLAKLLFEDKQYEASKDQFIRLRSDETLSEAQQTLITTYLTMLDKVDAWRFGGGAGLAYDPNIGNAPSERQILLNGGTWTFSEPEKAYGMAYSLTANRDFNLKGNYHLRIDTGVHGKSYWSNHDHDDTNVRLNVGMAYKDIKSEWAVLPYTNKRWLGGDDYNQESGVRGEYAHWLDPHHQLLGAIELGYDHYAQHHASSGKVAGGSLTWLFVPNTRQNFSVGADYAHKDANDKARAYDRYGVRATWTNEWQKGISTQLGLDIGKRNHGAKDIFGIKRHETEYTSRLSVWHRKVHFLGITPRLTITHRISDGNHPVYEYKKANAFVQFNKTF